MASRDSSQLFERFARKGDTQALGEVYDELAPELYRLALHLARDGAEAEDLLQATFVTAIERAASFVPGSPVRPWLSGILAHHARNAGRRAARTSPAEVAPVNAADEPIEAASAQELEEALARALAALPEAFRPALVLRFRHGLSVAEIAEALGSPPGTVRSQLARGTEHLRRRMPAGLGGVRALVLAHAESAAAPLTIGGLWIVKKWIAAAVVVLLLSGAVSYAVFYSGAADPAASALAVEPAATEPALASAPPVEPAVEAPQRVQEPQAVVAPLAAPAAQGASVEVELRYASTGELAPGVTVLLRVERLEISYFDERSAQSDASGRARWDGLPNGRVLARALQGGEAAGFVRAGKTLRLRVDLPDGVEVLGSVVERSGAAVPGARVWLTDPNNPTLGYFCARADEHGRFRLRSVGAGRWIGAQGANSALSYLQCVRGSAGEQQELRIVLEREGTRLSGTVFDDQRRPVPHAQVLAGSEILRFDRQMGDGLSVPSGAPQRTETDAEGRFEFDGLPLGPCTLRARAPGLVGAALELDLLPGSNQREIILVRSALVSGRVCDAAGAPLGQARVYSGIFGRFETRLTCSMADGRFTLGDLLPGEVLLVADHADGRRAEQRLELRAGERAEWNPRLSFQDGISGVVRSSSGQGLAGWSLLLADEDRARPGWVNCETDADGRFHLRAQPEHSYRLSVHEPQRWADLPRAELRGVRIGGPELAIEIREDASSEATLSARIVDPAGKPAAGARLILRHIGQDLWREFAPDGLGSVTVAHVPPGKLFLEVRSIDHPWRKLGEREARAGERIDLGTIELAQGGHVAGALRGAGRPQLELSLADERGLLAGSIEVQEDGYRSNALAPGRYTLYVRGSGIGDQRHDFEIAAGRELRLDLLLEPMPARKLLLQTGERTRASKYVTCFVNDEAGRPLCTRTVPVAGAASLELELSVPAGEHKLVVWGEGGQLLETQISASGAAADPPLTLSLP